MTLLILGAYGMLGHRLFRNLSERFDIYGTCRSIRTDALHTRFVDPARLIPGVTAENFDSVVEAIARVRPDAVVNCIGIIKHRKTAYDHIPSIAVNALFPHRIASLCAASGARMIHFSTDCVFNGRKGMYRPDDQSDAEDLYGRSKYLGEVTGETAVTIRSSIIGWELSNGSGLVEWYRRQVGRSIRGYRKAIYSGFTTSAMADIVATILTDHPNLSGLVQIASSPIDKFDLLCRLESRLRLGIEITPDDDFHCDRSLDGQDFAESTGFQAPTWDSMLDRLASEYDDYLLAPDPEESLQPSSLTT
jgi:dTDP-4-dehydrorhamnose reductase